MQSAFGIDHGYDEIEKFSIAGGAERLGAGVGGMFRRGAKVAGQQANKFQGSERMGAGFMHGTLKRTGQGMRKVSRFAAARPGTVGGITAGGAGVGAAGVGGVAYGNRRNRGY